MKVLYFLDYGKTLGGAAHTLMVQALLIRNAGNEVKFFLSNYYGNDINLKYAAYLYRYNIEPEMLPYHISSEPEDIDVVSLDENFDLIRDVLAMEQPDLIHSVQINTTVELACRELQIPHVMSVYPLSKDFFDIDWLDVFPRYLICDSEYWAKQWKRYIGVNYECIRTVVYDFPAWIEKHTSLENIKCICVGAIYEGKNQLEVIKGFQKALSKGFKGTLSLYGQEDSKYAYECQNYIIDHSLENVVRIMGFCDDMASVYAESDVLICGSKRESYPNVISEAMANSIIIVSTPVGGIPEIIEDGNNGYITNGYASDDFRDSLIRVKNDLISYKANQIRKNAYNTACAVHSPDNVGYKIEEYYNYIMDDYKKSKKSNYPSINDIRRLYKKWLIQMKESENEFYNNWIVREKIWYIKYMELNIQKAIKEGKCFYLWGAGERGKTAIQIARFFFDEIKIQGIIDSKAVGYFCDIPIVRPEKALKKNTIVLIGLENGQWDVVEILNKHSMKHGRDYFFFVPRMW